MTEEGKQYKIFGRRKGKSLSNLQKEYFKNYINDFSIFKTNDYGALNLRKINPKELFDGVEDIRLEIGFGMGDFLFEKALAHPNVGFVGCEVFENGVASLLAKIIKFRISNIRIHFGNCLDLIHNFNCLPTSNSSDEKVELVTAWPPTDRMSRWVFAVSGKKPIWRLGMPEKVVHAITENFGIGADSLDDSELDLDEEEDQKDDIEDQNAAIIRFVNEVIQRAIVDRATDIHFEPHKETLQIRYRIDGQLVPVRVPDNLRSFQDAIISRIKIMSAINISEKRRPQDGRISFASGDSELDIRISTIPTMYGESISLRLLNQKSKPLTMKELGLSSHEERILEKVLSAPHGIILVTGPTGSGKSTTLAAIVNEINKTRTSNIITVEDPVEFIHTDAKSIVSHREVGKQTQTFATALKAALREDPDVILVGEMRDLETVSLALTAAETGHLVFGTLHTSGAPNTINRIIDVFPPEQQAQIRAQLSTSLKMVVTQRLLKTKDGQGRVGAFEIMKCTAPIQNLIREAKIHQIPSIMQTAVKDGMVTMSKSLENLVAAGKIDANAGKES